MGGPGRRRESAAIINRGECSYRIENGTVLVASPGSPGSPWCLHEPQFYRMPMFDGMRDAGKNEFRLALLPLRGPWQDSGITQRAWSYNAPLPAVADCLAAEPSMGLRLSANGTMISTVKKAEDGDALIVRLYEFTGRGETVELQIPEGFSKAQSVNLLERQASPLPVGRFVQIEMKPFKLVTVRRRDLQGSGFGVQCPAAILLATVSSLDDRSCGLQISRVADPASPRLRQQFGVSESAGSRNRRPLWSLALSLSTQPA